MRYGSVCSGIEAATVAWEELGWTPAWFSEIDDFPSRVLAHHFPETPNLGDMLSLPKRVRAGKVEAPELLVGGTPCQAFSLAGMRESLTDARGNLTLAFVELANAIDARRRALGKEPAWVLWENVDGVFTVDDNAFGCFLGALVGRRAPVPEPRGGWTRAGVVAGESRVACWRVLDSQFFGVAQRRRRVFVLARGGARAWSAADALLPITESCCWNPAPRGKAGTRVARAPAGGAHFAGGADTAGALTASAGHHGHSSPRGDGSDTLVPEVTGTLTAPAGKTGWRAGALEAGAGQLVPEPLAFDYRKGGDSRTRMHATPEAPTLQTAGTAAVIAPAVTAKWAKGTGGPAGDEVQNLVTEPIPFDTTQLTHPENRSRPLPGDPAPTLAKEGHAPAIAFSIVPEGGQGADLLATEIDTAPALTAKNEGVPGYDRGVRVVQPVDLQNTRVGGDVAGTLDTSRPSRGGGQAVATGMVVRRLTPRECERLQSFPDDFTLIPGAKDGPRYKALGNSMTVYVMRFIGRAIERVEAAWRAAGT